MPSTSATLRGLITKVVTRILRLARVLCDRRHARRVGYARGNHVLSSALHQVVRLLWQHNSVHFVIVTRTSATLLLLRLGLALYVSQTKLLLFRWRTLASQRFVAVLLEAMVHFHFSPELLQRLRHIQLLDRLRGLANGREILLVLHGGV